MWHPPACVRICLVYDCLFPWTVGGAERWYRNLGERLAADGHAITYVTLRQWELEAPPRIPGVRVVAVVQGELVTSASVGDDRDTLAPPRGELEPDADARQLRLDDLAHGPPQVVPAAR